jgi:hypothetical protein
VLQLYWNLLNSIDDDNAFVYSVLVQPFPRDELYRHISPRVSQKPQVDYRGCRLEILIEKLSKGFS